MDQNPYEAPQTKLPRSEAVIWPWFLSWKWVCIGGGSAAVACILARLLTIVLRLHDPNNPWMIAGAIANIIGINLGILAFVVGATVFTARWLFGRFKYPGGR